MSNTETIQKLREQTGAGVVDCKKAFDEAGGDFDRAIEILHEKGVAKAAKRGDREAGAGMIYSYVHNDRIGVMLDVRAETDFVVRSEPFRELAKELAMQIAAMGGETVDEVLAQPYIKDAGRTVADVVKDVISRTGENVKLNKFWRAEV